MSHEEKCNLIWALINTHGITSSSRCINPDRYPKDPDIIARSLEPDEWLHLLPNGEDSSWEEVINKERVSRVIAKPIGMWSSKGDWLYHDSAGDHGVYKFKVNYDEILVITTLDEWMRFSESYETEMMEEMAFWRTIDWERVKREYKGICVVPMIYLPFNVSSFSSAFSISIWDVSSLVVWDMSVITSHQFLGLASEYISSL